MGMKKSSLKVLLIAVLCLVSSLTMACTVQAREKWEIIKYAQITANTALRTKVNSKAVATIKKIVPKGAIVTVKKYMKKNWYKVSYGSRTGYVLGDYFTDEDDEDLTDDVVQRTMAVGVTLRTSPTVLKDNAITVIPSGKKVTVVAERKDNWVHVLYGEREGYIKNGFFTTDAKCGKGYAWKYAAQALYIRSTPSVTQSNYVARLKKGKKIKITGVSGNWYKVLYKGKTRYVKEGYFTNEIEPGGYASETTASAIYFRRNTSTTEENVIRILKPGTAVKVYGSANKHWYKIKVGTKVGYIMGGYFTSDREQAETDTDPSNKRVTTVELNMREGRGTDYSIITTIPKGASVTIQIKYGEWYKVRYTSGSITYTGWVFGEYLASVTTA